MFKFLALLLTLISFAQEPSTLGPLKVKTTAGRSAYVGFVSRGKATTIFLSADAAAPERTESLPLAFVVDGRRIDLPDATRSKATGDARRDVMQRWVARVPADKMCEASSGEAISVSTDEMVFAFGPGLDELKDFAGRMCD